MSNTEKYEVDEAKDSEDGLNLLKSQPYGIVLCDVKMSKLNGLKLLAKAQELGVDSQFILISAHGTIETAVEAAQKELMTSSPSQQASTACR